MKHHPPRLLCLKVSALVACQIGLARAAPVSTVTLTGTREGPVVRMMIARTEREKVIGIDQQLAGMKLNKGKLIIETHDKDKPIVAGDLPAGVTLDWDVRVIWPKDVKDDFQYEAKPSPQQPLVTASNPDQALGWLRTAIGDSFSSEQLEQVRVSELDVSESSATQRLDIAFPAPRSGVSKSRQFRITRRLAAGMLEEFGMINTPTSVWPPGFPSKPFVCNYDAEGVGYYGSTLLDRVVDGTTLDFEVIPVCPEDIREGALEKAAGVMFPGGSGREISRALRPEGVQIVREFVAGGGGFFGVCAGAYFAASGLEEYAGMMHLKHTQPWAKGKGTVKLELTPEGKSLLGREFSSIETRYNCGPVFAEILDPPAGTDHQPVQVLARFASAVTDADGVTHDSMIGTGAILSTTWKKGRVMTISPHPEGHPEFNAMVARCIGWALGVDTKKIKAR